MLKSFLLSLLLSFVLLSGCSKTKQETPSKTPSIKDDHGYSFVFEEEPQRIITLAPNLTEMVYELGLGNRLIGNTLYCNYPDSAKNVEKVGDLLTVNFEKILELNPDLIFITTEGNTKEAYDRLIQLGQKVFISNPKSFKGIKKTFRDFGKIFNREDDADKLIKNWEERVAVVKNAVATQDHKSAMVLVSLKPIMLAGKPTYINEFLTICGLKNIANDVEIGYPVFNREQVLKRDPDFIIYSAGMNNNLQTIKEAYPEWSKLKAVKNNQVIFIDADLYFRPGPRFVLALEDLFGSIKN